ncbi:response regulator transcription factor [Streptomyces aidingensis]|uniref:Two-component system, NarL family, response regulator DesR n=1 Tax=Streptomyces aidingensis TaxID=910347 RepID=A0A1I1N2F6_9ACTN|nr:response regulator transcription factor [Streptomyces aidingensis]SFC89678.1 two-component system, NarL family, response regulator DesR [Streptomyces aidingensis]
MIRLLLVHDKPLLRSALASLMDRHPDIQVATASWEEADGAAPGSRPADVCMVDLDSRGRCRPAPTGAALLVLLEGGRPGLVRRASEARALGFVSKEAAPELLLDAVRQVAQHRPFVDDTLARDFLRAAQMPLTGRELSVLALAAEGAPVAEIAAVLSLARGTVRNYLAAVIHKTGARNRVDAIRIARAAGWV